MKRFIKYLCLPLVLIAMSVSSSNAQALKVNVPFALLGTPNLGAEFMVGRQFSVNGDVMWAPYMFKKNQEVYRALIASTDFRYYINPNYYYTNNMFDGFYLGPYAMWGNFNIGRYKGGTMEENRRYVGWGLSTGLSIGYKMFLSNRFRIDFNLGVGYAHLQYDIYMLGGENADQILEPKATTAYWGPTKFGIHLVYNIFK